ncbi:class I SAM-dependent methyltransferase [Brachybacterium sp. MASK1Z-5]|uniref:Class I SAM-dependent methyltransferase n=1 Tax=Brachybacterium halotolerans TaxID=2795215 RepID=A0ABS1B5T7_9MICO|nr:class I SAM-dependent methyltransferase [Brachybacterium halotolerans]MBK0329985.1 class I SAM-dependent methyltransferase [Brachybacterium halotolerans]
MDQQHSESPSAPREEIPGAPVPDLFEQSPGLDLPELPWRVAQSASALAQLSHHVLAIGPRAARLLARLRGTLAEEGVAALPVGPAHSWTRERLGSLGLEVLDHDPTDVGATLPFPPERFDLVLVVDAPYDPREVHRVLAPEGLLLAQQRGPGDLAELGSEGTDGSGGSGGAADSLADHLRRVTEAGLETEHSDTFHGEGRIETPEGLRALCEGEGLLVPPTCTADALPLRITLSRYLVQARRPSRPAPARTDFAEMLDDPLEVPRV